MLSGFEKDLEYINYHTKSEADTHHVSEKSVYDSEESRAPHSALAHVARSWLPRIREIPL